MPGLTILDLLVEAVAATREVDAGQRVLFGDPAGGDTAHDPVPRQHRSGGDGLGGPVPQAPAMGMLQA